MNRAADDLISRAVACDEIGEMIHEYREKGDHSLADALILVRRYVLKQLPAVDAAPVVHGRWLEERPNTYMRKVKCSVCNGPAPFICRSADYYGRNMHGDFAKTKYCPCCGARMETKNE